MRYAPLGPLAQISRLTLGGGGLGQGWGKTSIAEAVATVHAGLDAGINLLDTAPMYLDCERVIAESFGGKLPRGVAITSKCQLGEVPDGTVAAALEASLDASCTAMQVDHIDIFFLHSNICEDDAVFAFGNAQRAQFATPWRQYCDEVIPAFEALRARGRIGAWGITAIGVPATILKALEHPVKPAVVQAISNVLDSAGGIRRFAEPANPRAIIAAANRHGIGVMGVRAVQAGALTAQLDRPLKASHPDAVDFHRAAPYRALCREWAVDPAVLAHRYALDMAGVATVVLGVKNRAEMAQCLEAEALGPLPNDMRQQLTDLGRQMAG